MDKIKNVDLCKKPKVTPIADKINNSQIRWFGHVRRRPSDHPIARAYYYTVRERGPRSTGRPRKIWFQHVDEYLMEKEQRSGRSEVVQRQR